MTYQLENLIKNFTHSSDNPTLQTKLNQIDEFNKQNANTFKFGNLDLNDQTNKSFTNRIHDCLTTSWTYLNQSLETEVESVNLHSRFIIACLDAIRLISRDTGTIGLFEDSKLLDLIQQIACLSSVPIKESDLIQNITLNALKSMSNLIYNSKFAQDFYVNNGVAETITIYLKQFSLNDIFGQNTKTNKLNIMIFNLRILFLLTVFNKDLRSKLREKLQVLTYLIEIIDLVMKERLNVSDSSTEESNPDNSDYCYLNQMDIDFINEILKILYNLTMDIAKPPANLVQVYSNEEEEAHLMHLVSVLRDLMTCKLENEPSVEKLNDLHSNIINLLTNMPSICFEELMTPCTSSPSTHQVSAKQTVEPKSNYYFNIRLAHNKKRQSRRSKRLTQREKQDEVRKSSQSTQESLGIMGNDEDMEFEGKNIEAIALILTFMNRHVNNYINKPYGYNADQIYPVLLLLSLMSKSNTIIRHYCRLKVLPPLNKKDLVNLPQNGLHIRNRLVRLMTDANIQVKRLSAQFLFILCKESIRRLIKYTGYGNAAGLLAEAGLMLSTHGDRSAYSSDSDDSDTEDYKRLEECINPVTGRAEIEEAQLDTVSKKFVRPPKKTYSKA